MEVNYEKEIQKLLEREQELINDYEICYNKLNEMIKEDNEIRKKLEKEEKDGEKFKMIFGSVAAILILLCLIIFF